MCNECHQSPHATMCPNGTPMVDEYLVDCALCDAEVDEETTTYGICEKCWTDAHTFDNALAYGTTATESVKINGLFAKVLTPDQINEALKCAVMDMKKFYYGFTVSATNDFLSDDDGAFASWLKEQKNID
jgi:hypothetical protein